MLCCTERLLQRPHSLYAIADVRESPSRVFHRQIHAPQLNISISSQNIVRVKSKYRNVGKVSKKFRHIIAHRTVSLRHHVSVIVDIFRRSFVILTEIIFQIIRLDYLDIIDSLVDFRILFAYVFSHICKCKARFLQKFLKNIKHNWKK